MMKDFLDIRVSQQTHESFRPAKPNLNHSRRKPLGE